MMHSFKLIFRGSFVLSFTWLMVQSAGFAATNSWVPSTSGDWQIPANWSLGILPNSSQSVRIDSPGWKAVAITPVTSANFPTSLTVLDLVIRNNSTQDVNTL